MHVHGVASGWSGLGTCVRTAVAIVLALLGLAAFGASRGLAEAVLPTSPLGPIADGQDVRATVDVTQEDDIYDLSPGMDSKARMSWSSTKEVTQDGRVLGVEGGGSYNAVVSARTNPGYPCDPTDYSLTATGEVSDSTPLTFRFVPKDRKHPGRGLKGWFIHTPTAMWKGSLTVTKPDSGMCGESYTQDGGSWFAAQAFAGGTLTARGAPMAAPSVKVMKNGDVRIGGAAVYATGATRRVVRFAILCTSRQACFGQKIPKPRKDLRIGWKYLGGECIPGPANTFRMRVRVRMIADNGDTSWFGRSWASRMRAGARLESMNEGTDLPRRWVWASTGELVPNRRYQQDFTILTDNVSATADGWRLHLRYVWEITGWRDLERDVLGAQVVAPCGDVAAPQPGAQEWATAPGAGGAGAGGGGSRPGR